MRGVTWIHLACIACLPVAGCASLCTAENEQQPRQVVAVVGGQSIVVSSGRDREEVRYAGIDTSRAGQRALAANKILVEGKTIWMEREQSRDQGYVSVYAFITRIEMVPDDHSMSQSSRLAKPTMVNELLVRCGYATANVDGLTNASYADQLRKAEEHAKAHRRGLWGDTDEAWQMSEALVTYLGR